MKFSQNGWVVLVAALILLVIIKFALPGAIQIVAAVVIIALVGLVYKMTIIIDEFRFKITMGVGLLGDEVPVRDIESCKVYDGNLSFGPRRNDKYVIYNINSKRAVEIAVKGKQRAILIGCDNPEELVDTFKEFIR